MSLTHEKIKCKLEEKISWTKEKLEFNLRKELV